MTDIAFAMMKIKTKNSTAHRKIKAFEFCFIDDNFSHYLTIVE